MEQKREGPGGGMCKKLITKETVPYNLSFLSSYGTQYTYIPINDHGKTKIFNSIGSSGQNQRNHYETTDVYSNTQCNNYFCRIRITQTDQCYETKVYRHSSNFSNSRHNTKGV